MTVIPKECFEEGNLQDFGEYLHWERAEKGLTCVEVAQLLECPQSLIDDLECGKLDVDMELIKKMIDTYGFKMTLGIEGWDD